MYIVCRPFARDLQATLLTVNKQTRNTDKSTHFTDCSVNIWVWASRLVLEPDS